MELKTQIVEEIKSLIQTHGTDWKCGFNRLNGMPSNPITGATYTGFNALWLGLMGIQYAATFNQWKKAGYKIRKGSKSIKISRPSVSKKVDEDGKEETKTWFRPYSVFSSECIVNFDTPPAFQNETQTCKELDDLLLVGGTEIRTSQDGRAFYDIKGDYISLPPVEAYTATQFSTATQVRYGTEMHEKGHELGKYFDAFKKKFDRAKEELVAEIFSSMACIGKVQNRMQPENAQYIGSWLQGIKDDENYLVDAVDQAFDRLNLLNEMAASRKAA
tara:strand:- start:12 stop:833 length:822 start_codon:yes stop_codon:yes gene_type:complete